MTPDMAPLKAPDSKKDTSLNKVHHILVPSLSVLGLTPGAVVAIATGSMQNQGSGPGGGYSEQELNDFISAGALTLDDEIYLQLQIPNAPSGNPDQLYDAADMIRTLEGYRAENQVAPDPSFRYSDRVIKLYADSFRNALHPNDPTAPTLAAQNALLSLPPVIDVVTATMEAAIKAATPPGPTIVQ